MNIIELNEGFEDGGEERLELRLVKLEGVDPSLYVDLLYAEQHDIIFDRVILLNVLFL